MKHVHLLCWASQVVLVVKNPPANAGDVRDRNPWVRKLCGEGNSSPLQYSCLENSMDRGAWRATVHGVTEPAMTEHAHLSIGPLYWNKLGIIPWWLRG